MEAALAGKEDGQKAQEDVVATYKEALARAKENNDRFVTPSSFRIPLDGSDPIKHPDKLLCGLEGAEFAPLPQVLRERFPMVAKTFSGYYRQYRDSIVRPVVGWMRTADRALFLVDVFSCLNGGIQAYNGAQAETEASLDALRRVSAFETIRNLFTHGVPQSRVAGANIRIVVTKMDLADKQGRKNLLSLACQMFGKKVKSVTGFKSAAEAFLTCASVQTDKEKAKGSVLKKKQYLGIPDGTNDEPGAGIPKHVPDNLDDWKGQFPLKEINPAWFNLRVDLPPKHKGLNRIARFVLGLPVPPDATGYDDEPVLDEKEESR